MANVSKPKTTAEQPAEIDPKVPRMHSVHLPEATKGPRRRTIDLGNRGKFLFNADVTGKENRKLPGYPHHRMRLTAEEAKQFANDGFNVRLLTSEELAEAPKAPADLLAIAQAVADAKAKDKE